MSLDDFSSGESSDEKEMARNFDKEAQSVIQEKVLPAKSRDRYQLVYQTFLKWQNSNNTDSFDENVVICYINDLMKHVNPTTTWCVWFMLKKMLNVNQHIDIKNYLNLKAILKKNSVGHKPRKSLTLSWTQIMSFMKNADDYIYLGAKVLLVFGICGALRCCELTNIKFNNVEDKSDKCIVSIQDTKNDIDRSFDIGPFFYPTIKNYISLRPPENFTDKFFIQFHGGKCQKMVVGKNKIGLTPASIASFLKLDNSSNYTGHCYRRTSATLLSNSGASMSMLKQLDGWKSEKVAAGYVADSMRTKDLIFLGITYENKNHSEISARPSTSKQNFCENNGNSLDNLSDLGLTYEDFYDSSPQESNVNLAAGTGQQSSSTPLQENNTEKVTRNLCSHRSPVKLSFKQPIKKFKNLEGNANDSTFGNENVQPMVNKNPNIVFENYTINSNIVNNYYYKDNEDPKEL